MKFNTCFIFYDKIATDIILKLILRNFLTPSFTLLGDPNE